MVGRSAEEAVVNIKIPMIPFYIGAKSDASKYYNF